MQKKQYLCTQISIIPMTSLRKSIILILCTLTLPVSAQIGMQALGDSLMAYTGFSRVWSPTVRVKQMRVNGNEVILRTNGTLKDFRWTPRSVAEIKRKASIWVLGNENGEVTIYSGKAEIADLITECARAQKSSAKCKKTSDTYCDLTERTIALWPSHGLYYDQARDEWIWQRATIWTTVEDLYSQEYVRQIRRMLQNAGANVVIPRAGLEQQELGASGMPQWTEGARYWLKNNGIDAAVWNLYDGNEYKDDMKCRPMWVNSLETTVDLCLAFHTDGLDSGDDSTIVGTLAIYTAKDDDGNTTLRDGRDRETVNRNLADWIQTQVTEDLRHIVPEWTRRQLKEANYCESRVPVVPSLILELLSHKNMADMRYGLDPSFRFAAARAVYKGILRYLNGPSAIVQPLPVEQLGINADGILSWEAKKDSIEPSATPSYFMVYTQADDGEWDVQQVDKSTQVKLEMKSGVRYNCFVVAGNDGGLSLPSPIVSAYRSSDSDQKSMALIIDAFSDTYGPKWFADSTYAGIVPGSYACEDRFSCAYIGEQWDFKRDHPWINDDNCGWGSCYRDHAGQLTIGNTHDYSALHGRILQQMNISYTSCTAGMLQKNPPATDFTLVDIICGRQRVPLTAASQQFITDYLDKGGRLLLSTDHFSALEKNWAATYLHATYYAANATRSGRLTSDYQICLTPNDTQLFTCTPEGLRMEGEGAKVILSYRDMRCPAAIGATNTNEQQATKTLVFGFPLETCTDFERIYRSSVEWLMK